MPGPWNGFWTARQLLPSQWPWDWRAPSPEGPDSRRGPGVGTRTPTQLRVRGRRGPGAALRAAGRPAPHPPSPTLLTPAAPARPVLRELPLPPRNQLLQTRPSTHTRGRAAVSRARGPSPAVRGPPRISPASRRGLLCVRREQFISTELHFPGSLRNHRRPRRGGDGARPARRPAFPGAHHGSCGAEASPRRPRTAAPEPPTQGRCFQFPKRRNGPTDRRSLAQVTAPRSEGVWIQTQAFPPTTAAA